MGSEYRNESGTLMRSATAVSMERNLSATGHTLDYNIEKLQALSAGSANAMAAAFESFKVFQPELSRLSGKTVELRQGIEDIHPLIRSLQVPGDHFQIIAYHAKPVSRPC